MTKRHMHAVCYQLYLFNKVVNAIIYNDLDSEMFISIRYSLMVALLQTEFESVLVMARIVGHN